MIGRLLSLAVVAGSAATAVPSLQSRAPSGSKTVIIQMFQWNWDSIASECTDFIGPAGYGFVQVSPPAEHITGSQWSSDYAPVSYTLTSKRGNRSQFQNMIARCKAAGVGVIADTIMNHMSGMQSGTGVGGSTYTKYNYPGTYQTQDFHHCGLEPYDVIVNYNNRLEVQTCELDGLSDLATDTEWVRGRLASYIQDLQSLGVVGLRLDAAKHIPASDISNILGRLSTKPYVTQEVGAGSTEPIQPSEYVGNGDVQEFRYTSALQDAFQSGGISSLNNLESRGWIPSTGANVFVSNHDTERTGASLSYKSGAIYTLAHVFMMAYPYGTPTILSSYTFSDTNAGSPANGTGSCSGSGGTNGWQCQHRWTAIAGMVKWRNGVSGAVNNWVSGTAQQIAFGRGSTGYVVVNNADLAWSRTFLTPLAAGSYCDVVSGSTGSSGTCTGTPYTVSGGTFTATVPARSAIALFTGAIGKGSFITFQEYAETVYGDNIFVIGSIPALGAWAPENSIALSAASYPTWVASVPIPAGTSFSYKYIRKTANGTILWESDPNRSASTPSSGTVVVNDSWR
ncbi:glycoside hydrolase [Ceratobasidium sp. AG-I]|nr:glycoside hydrolase [Ceratobasidium sp. AG-I]